MKRTIKRDIRWNQYEIDQIEEAAGPNQFSQFVRDAAMEKAIEINDHAGNPRQYN